MEIPRPYWLKLYQPGEFEAVHAAGSGIITASNIPALFGQSRFLGRYALAAHVSGRVPLPEVDSNIIRRGRMLERVTTAELAESRGWIVEAAEGYAEHPTFGRRCIASPDNLLLDPARGPDDIGINEGKVVEGLVFQERWSDGPPLDVELQHQCQFMNTGAAWGAISALVMRPFGMDLIVYDTKPNQAAIALIESAVRSLLDMLAAGQLPEPDTHESAAAVLQALHPVDPGKEIALAGAEAVEAGRLFDDWKAASEKRLAAEKTEKAAKAWFMAKAGDASRLLIGNDRRVEIKDQERAGYTVKPPRFRTVKLIEASAA